MSNSTKYKDRIATLRGVMKREQLQAYIIPSFDPHQSEYVHDYWKAISWFCNFSGSAGILILTLDHAILWTDSRYYIQASLELKNTDVVLYTSLTSPETSYADWLLEHLPIESTIGLDGELFSINQIKRLEKKFNTRNIQLNTTHDLVREIWTDRPALVHRPIYEVHTDIVGKGRKQKIASIRASMEKKQADVHFLSSLDDIAWTLNLRGDDITFNPVFFSYLWISKEETLLFVDQDKIAEPLALSLKEHGIKLASYRELSKFFSFLPQDLKVWVDPNTLNYKCFAALKKQGAQFIKGRTVPYAQKSIKNKTEIRHLRSAMIKDGIALTKLFMWLESILENAMVTEYEIARQLNRFRQSQGNYIGESFPAIVGYQSNGAIVHYRPQPNASKPVKPNGILLLDSGGQYQEGTTDITRTICLGPNVDEKIKKHYTLVLKGNIALSSAIFPEGTNGGQLDILARQFLWQSGLNYGHGTGHGVGFFLNVHEGPQGISPNTKAESTQTIFRAGMVTSNEPGLYISNAYGIRIENLILCIKKMDGVLDGKPYLGFEALSLFPFDLDLILSSLLSQEEKNWINTYHQRVFDILSKKLNPEEQKWLEQKCQPII